MKIFVNTWGNYNKKGANLGQWITLPMDELDLENKLKEIAEDMQDQDPKWFVNDFDCEFDIEINENSNIFEVNELAQRLEDLDEWDKKKFQAMLEIDSDFEYCLDNLDDATFYPDMSLEEVAEEIVKECYSHEMSEFMLRYFDYEAFALDLSYEDYTETKYGVICW